MTKLQILFQAILKTIKYFPLVLPTVIIGLAVLAVEERRSNYAGTKRKFKTS